MAKIAIIQYSTFGHITKLSAAIQEGIQSAGGEADILEVPETLADDVLALIGAPPKQAKIPQASADILLNYDAFLFGIPTRFGNFPSQWSTFWDSTGSVWATGGLYGKPAGVFVSTGTQGGGQESTIRNVLSTLTHHGMIYVPLGYKYAGQELGDHEEIHGGSPWGAGTFAGGDGSRSPTVKELNIAKIQGETFYSTVEKFTRVPEITGTEPTTDPVSKSALNTAPATAPAVAAAATSTTAAPAAANSANPVAVEQKNEPKAESKQTKTKKVSKEAAARSSQSTPTEKEKSSGCAKCIIM